MRAASNVSNGSKASYHTALTTPQAKQAATGGRREREREQKEKSTAEKEKSLEAAVGVASSTASGEVPEDPMDRRSTDSGTAAELAASVASYKTSLIRAKIPRGTTRARGSASGTGSSAGLEGDVVSEPQVRERAETHNVQREDVDRERAERERAAAAALMASHSSLASNSFLTAKCGGYR